jgi:hypothetical protein
VAPNEQVNIHFSMEKYLKIINWVQVFRTKRIISAVKRVEFVSDGLSYITLRSRWCNIIVLNVHAPTGDKIVDLRTGFMKNWNRNLINSQSTI